MADADSTVPVIGEGMSLTETDLPAFDRAMMVAYRVLVVALLLFMTVLIGADVILRVTIGAPIRGSLDMVSLGLLTLVIFALPVSWNAGFHARMDMLYSQFGPGWKLLADMVSSLLAMIFGLLLSWQAFNYIPQIRRMESSSPTLGIPYWPFAAMIGVSGLLFALSVAIGLVHGLRAAKHES